MPLTYLISRHIKNWFRQMIKKPAILILYVLLFGLIGFSVIMTLSGKSNQSAAVSEYYGTALTALALFVLAMAWRKGLDSGGTFFWMCDVNFLFPAPIRPRRILLYGLVQNCGTLLLTMLFVSFQTPNLINLFGLGSQGIAWFMICTLLLVFLTQLLVMALYAFSAGHDKRRLWLRRIMYIVGIAIGILLVWRMFVTRDAVLAVRQVLDHKVFLWFPIAGWVKALAIYMPMGELRAALPFLLLTSAAFFGLLAVVLFNRNEFYEDVLSATETKEAAKNAKREGRAFDNKKISKRMRGHIGLRHGQGASVLFFRHMLQAQRTGIWFVDGITLVLVVCGVASRFLFKQADIIIPFYFSIYLLFIINATGMWMRELLKPYIYMIPANPFHKLLAAIAYTLVKALFDAVALFTVAGVATAIPVWEVLLCILGYISYSLLYTSGTVLSQRLLGERHSKGLAILILLGTQLFLVMPGLVISITCLVISGAMRPFVFIAPTLWNIAVSWLILYLCRGLLHNMETA